MPDCDETHYTASVSASPFRKCDYKNMGLTALCNLGGSGGEMGDIEPPMWGESVINQYRSVAVPTAFWPEILLLSLNVGT